MAGAGCAKSADKLVQVPPPGFRQDVFPQDAASKIDLLWVIDDSGSMAPEIGQVAASTGLFFGLIQTFVFTMLTTIYLSWAVSHEH